MRTLSHRILISDAKPNPANVLRLDHTILPLLVSMEKTGMLVDSGHINSLHSSLTLEMAELQSKVTESTGYSINIASGDQLSDLLFSKGKLHLKQPGKERRTTSGVRLSADSDVLRGMISQHPAIKLLLDWKEREKLRSTYTHSLIAQCDEEGRVHPDINHTGPETGRLSCSAPNLQNVPTRTKLGQEIRKAFIPGPGNILGTIDLSQIEMRQIAEDSKCPAMIKVFRDGVDLYWSVAEAVFRREFSKDDREHGVEPVTGLTFKEYYRQAAKVTALMTIYEASPSGVLDQMLVFDAVPFLTGGEKLWDYDRHYEPALKRCADAIIGFFDGYPELLRRRKVHHRRATKYGLVWDMFGRHRMIPQVYSTHRWVVGEGLRAAGNHPIQAGPAGILKLWLACIWDHIESYWYLYGIRPLICVHDELIVEGPRAAVEDFLEECSYILRTLLPPDLYTTPLKASWATAGSWGEIKK